MKIGVLSDTHLYRITRELEDLYDRYLSDVDLILHAGDFVSAEVVDFFSGDDFHGVHGNMDPMDVREMLPDKKVMELGSQRLALIHGWGSSDTLEDKICSEFGDVDVIVYGHSHRAANHMRGGILFFNPGTAIGYNPAGPHTIGILEISDIIKGKILNI